MYESKTKLSWLYVRQWTLRCNKATKIWAYFTIHHGLWRHVCELDANTYSNLRLLCSPFLCFHTCLIFSLYLSRQIINLWYFMCDNGTTIKRIFINQLQCDQNLKNILLILSPSYRRYKNIRPKKSVHLTMSSSNIMSLLLCRPIVYWESCRIKAVIIYARYQSIVIFKLEFTKKS